MMTRIGGVIYCFTLPSFDPIPANAIQPIRGVAAFALDEDDTRKDHYLPPQPPPVNNPPWVSSGQTKILDPVSLYVFRDTKIFPYTIAQRMISTKVCDHSLLYVLYNVPDRVSFFLRC